MKIIHKLVVRLGAIGMMLFMGCSPACHCYSGCHVNCRYCPPLPLPYTSYSGCVCHSSAASKYLSVVPGTVELTDNGPERDPIPLDDFAEP
jgi:hypothetical protein